MRKLLTLSLIYIRGAFYSKRALEISSRVTVNNRVLIDKAIKDFI